MKSFQIKTLLISGGLLLSVLNLQAQDKVIPIQTSYSISTDSSSVTTILTEDKSKDELINKYLFPEVEKVLIKNPLVSNVAFVPGMETSTEYSWANYITKKRESFAYVNIDVGSQISFLFKITEELRVCKTGTKDEKNVVVDEWSGTSSSTTSCDINSLQTNVKIEGPVAVYGTYASQYDVGTLLKDRQEITVTLNKNWSKQFQMVTRFRINSSSFEDGLIRFFEAFQIKSMIGDHFTRKQLLVGVARAMRTINEGMLEL